MKRKSQQINYVNRFIDSRWETGIVRQGENWQVDMVITHVGGPTAPSLAIATFRLKKNPNMNPSELVELSMEEGRLLRDTLNRREIQPWLEEGEK